MKDIVLISQCPNSCPVATGIDDEVRLGIKLRNSFHDNFQSGEGQIAVEVAIVTGWTLATDSEEERDVRG